MNGLHIRQVISDDDSVETANDSGAIHQSTTSVKEMLTLSVSDKVLLHAHEANTFFSRLRGLHAHLPLADNEALIISPCHAVHTYTMTQAIDVAFVDGTGKVLDVRTLQPRRWGSVPGAAAVVEMNAGVCASLNIVPGVRLQRGTGAWR